jgi:hypothetical protein
MDLELRGELKKMSEKLNIFQSDVVKLNSSILLRAENKTGKLSEDISSLRTECMLILSFIE